MSLDLFPTALSLVQLHDCITIYIQVSSASRLPVESLHKTIGVTALLRTNIQIAQLVLPGRITMDGNGDRKCSTFWLLGGSRFRAMSLKTSSKSLKQPLGTETITHTLKVRRFYTSICTYIRSYVSGHARALTGLSWRDPKYKKVYFVSPWHTQ